MSKILIVSDDSGMIEEIDSLLVSIGYNTLKVSNEKGTINAMEMFQPDIALVDTSCAEINISMICKKLKLQGETNDVQIILLTSENTSSEEVMVGADGYITRPFNENILIATINAHLRIKKLLDILYTNNSELARSLYQLNVMYNTASQFAGTLDKAKLVEILNEGLEKSLNFSLCSTLIINEYEDATLVINARNPLTERLEHALKLRALLGYKNHFENKKIPFELSIESIAVEKHVKNEGDILDLNILDYDNLFSPICSSDRFFGTVEVLRAVGLTGEDSTCFQTLVKQVSLPMESAVLYEEIKKTNIKLEKLEKLKSEFISIVSHELRTPLTAIKNSLDIMLSGKAGEITKIMDNFLNMASRNVSRLSGIINDLLDLSKIEAGKMEYRFESLNIAEPVEFVKNTFEHTAQKKNINIVLCLEKTLPQIYGDINRIEQILSNLVSNAIKFTPENGQITISAKIIDSKALDTSKFYHDTSAVTVKPPLILRGHYVKISVEDTGIGIKEEDIPKVFDKFQQIESSLSREVGGTGLGLPIARQLIEAHRGEIWVDSEVGKGTKFCFILPAMEHHNTFLLELDNELQHAKYSHSSFVLMLIEEKMHSGGHISITHDIADGKINIIRKRDKSKIFVQNGIALNKMQIILPNTDKLGVNFVIKRLEEFLNENAVEYACQDIFTGITVYPDDAITSEEILEHALKDMHCIHKTNNIN